MSTKVNIAFCMPCANSVEPVVLRNALAVVNFAACNGYPCHMIGVTDRVLVHTARNVLAKEALKTDSDWIFWMDSDMILPLETIPKMMQYAERLNAKFLTGEYYKRLGKHEPLAQIVRFKDGKERRNCVYPRDDRAFKIDACGFGCVLVHKSVFEVMEFPYFKYETEGQEVSEDFYFCQKAREKNIDIWLVPEIDCGHVGQAPIITKKDFVPGQLENINVEGVNK